MPLFLPIQPFGTSIVLGIMCAYAVFKKHPLLCTTAQNDLTSRLIRAIIWAGIIGGRVLYWIVHSHEHAHWIDFFMLQKGGMSSQGAILGILSVIAINVIMHGKAVIAIADALASCAPLVQAIARIGCFFAGCCYGTYCSYTWAVTYSSSNSLAPLCVPLHPTQLYSCLALMLIFFILQLVLPRTINYPGLTTALYLFLMAIERFVVEFFRGESIAYGTWFTVHQYIAIMLACTSLLTMIGLLLFYILYDKKMSFKP